uniref:Adhesion G protein-coupled receptor A3 n=1 Tax=Cyprinus carpio TaxID=7962 RepID=A0A8C2BE14_CYPCA
MSLGASCVLLLAFVLLRSSSSAGSTECKSYDERSRSAGKSSPSGATLDRKVVCSNMELHQVPSPESFPNRTVSLDIKNNIITHIEPGAFYGLFALKRLDLSKNLIGCLHVDVFKGLTNLVKLNLSENKFSSLSQGIFDSLGSLKILEFDSPYLLCDCNLQWLVVWIREKAIGVKETRCLFPRSLQGQQITSLRPETLTCDAPLELPSFQMTPSQHQIVFQGDSLPFQCMASFVDEDMQVLWYQDGKMVEPDVTQGIYIEKSMVQNCSLIASALTISNIQPGFTGNWECRVRTSRGNNTRTVHIVVLESSAKYCLPDRVANNKGDYRWPRTLAGITAYLPCKRQVSGAGIYSGSSAEDRRAWRRCGRSGQWAEDDYSRCEYMKDVTRVLYIINQMPLNLTNAVQTAQQLLAYTAEAPNFSDKVDVIFVAEMIEKIGKFAEKYKELGDVMVDISSNLMLADERVLWMAQREARACSRIVECLQRIALLRISNGALAYSTNSHNIALEAHAIKASSFNGMTCTLFQKLSPERTPVAHFSPRDPDINPERQLSFKCNVTSNLSALALKNTIVEASLQLPPSLFSSLGSSGQADEAVYKLHLLAFRNGKLFPPTGNSTLLSDGSKRRSVVTPVILTKIEGFPLKNLQSPVNVTLRRFLHGSDAVPSFWNFSLLGGQGGWQSDGCRILHQDDNFTTMSCHSLNNYALLMDLNRTGNDAYCFEPLHPVIYATAIILVLCLLSVIVSYIYHHKSVRVSKKCWHMLVNLCSHMLLTCAVFVGGINQTHSASVCQAVGIVLHYSTLATALWSGVTARNIYKQVTRKAKRYEELDEPPPPPRPMLRFYLIGGGIPIIVCGITAAANIKNYGSQVNAPYCWMAWEPSLGAFYGPAAFIVFVDCMYFLSILVQLRRHPERRFELKEQSEEQQHLSVAEATEITPAHLESLSAAQPVPMSALENEHTFVAQLIGVAGSLALYVALWVFGALAVSQEHPADLVFACLFGTAALALGAFLVAHHCVNRQDMRHHWSRACCLVRRNYAVQIDSLLLPVSGAGGSVLTARGNGETAKCPASSAESSCTNKSAPSVRNSTQGCKLTNLQVEAAQCKAAPSTANGTALLDNSLTEHSVDNEIKMHIAPVEVQYRPNSVNNNNLSGTGITNINGHSGRHHKNRARAHRASRLTVLREYSYDVPTSVEGSVQSVPHKRHHHHESLQARNSRRAAYLAYRERQQSQLQQDSSDASTSVPRRSRHLAKGGGVRPNNSFGHGLSNSLGNGVSNGGLVGGGDGSGTDVNSQTRDCPKQPLTVELEVQPKSYGLNLACQNGPAKDAERLQNLSPLNVESSGNIKTGLWNHETTV